MAEEKNINKTVKDKIIVFAKLLKQSGISVDSLILYGSHAKGKPRKFSDIDLCVVSPNFRKNMDDYFRKIWKLAARVDSSLEPIPFTPEELSDKYSTLSTEIRNSGIRII